MSERKWKTGEVAMARHRTSFADEFMVIRSVNAYWQAPGGWPGHVSADDCDYRPLVVIDPENREQVERLVREMRLPVEVAAPADRLQAALREFADPKPPKPEEPTRLAAVVEDGSGVIYLRTEIGDNYPWIRVGIGSRRNYDDIDAVKVLSDGIPA